MSQKSFFGGERRGRGRGLEDWEDDKDIIHVSTVFLRIVHLCDNNKTVLNGIGFQFNFTTKTFESISPFSVFDCVIVIRTFGKRLKVI